MKKHLRKILVMAIIAFIASACASQDRFIVHHTNGTVLDTKTNLMWAAKDNGSDVNWTDAKSYCENYAAGNFKDWRLPTSEELAGLYEAQQTREAPCAGNFNIHMATELIQVTCFAAWSSETRNADASLYNFIYGRPDWYLRSHTYGMRALPVRNNK